MLWGLVMTGFGKTMLNFNYNVSTRILFGKNKVKELGDEIKQYSDSILLVYGGGSVKKTGLYNKITKSLKKNNIFYKELSGIQPNPRITSVRKGIKLCKENNINFILAVGGGSVIDCSKAIAAGFYWNKDPWSLFLEDERKIKKALPIGTVLTLAATGSEMNGNAVISNEETKDKMAIHNDKLRPKFSILDPTFTFTVSKKHTAAGTVDIYSHILEQYFSLTGGAFVQDRISEALMKSCINYGPIAMKEPENYEARANLMWTGSLALNGLIGYGKITDWATHMIEHSVSALYDVTHGIGLAVLTPFWMEYVLDEKTAPKFAEYAKNIWNLNGTDDMKLARGSIEKTKEFFKSLGMPKTLQEVGVKEDTLEEMAKKTVMFGPVGNFKKLGKKDVLKILTNAY